MQSQKQLQPKALLAIAFASSTLYAAQPPMSADSIKTPQPTAQQTLIGPVISQLASSTLATPEIRAYYLLRLAQDSLTNRSQDGGAQLEKTFETYAAPRSNSQFFKLRNNGNMLSNFADEFFYGGMVTVNANSVSKEDAANCDSATLEALRQLDQASEKSDKLCMYLIASRFFERTGNINEQRKCESVVNKELITYEKQSNNDEKRLCSAFDILNSMAFGIVPIQVPEREPIANSTSQFSANNNHCTNRHFRESELLKLRAIALVDRLPANNFVRRKAHRDLTLWYMELGKPDLADKQKQILFELVGRKDDSLLYPKVVACGHLDWFPDSASKANKLVMMCGMG